MEIVAVGHHCNISELHRLIGISQPTGVFEWLEIPRLAHAVNLLNLLLDNPDIEPFTGEGTEVRFADQGFRSYHYPIEEYRDIFPRRFERFLKTIRTNDQVFFARINPSNCRTPVTPSELIDLLAALRRINPRITVKFLLVDTVPGPEVFTPLEFVHEGLELFHRFFLSQDCQKSVFLKRNKKVGKIYRSYLHEAGWVPF